MADSTHAADESSERTRRREARAIVAGYHQEQLRVLLEHVREGFGKLDAGEIDEFKVDDLIHRYKRAAKQLWMFCGSADRHLPGAAAAIAQMRDRGEERNWWADSARRGDQL